MKEIIKNRIEKIRKILENTEKDGLLLSREENIAYLTFGARNRITLNNTEGVASILITQDDVFFITNNIEMNRLFSEEIPEALHELFKKVEYRWWQSEYDSLSDLIKMKHLISDTGRYMTKNVSTDINAHRYVLCEPEFKTLRSLGKVIDEVFTKNMPLLNSQMTELEVQALFFREFFKLGYDPILILVFGEESARLYRHNLPRDAKLGNQCFVSFCVRDRGLVISSTRTIMFTESTTLREQHEKNCRIDAKLISFSRPGKKMDELFSQLDEAYASEGYPDEWMLHHQGGLAGYKSRELVCTPNTRYTMMEGNCIAWNPTITGTKSEDTAVLLKGTNEIVSFPPSSKWPALEFKFNGDTIRRPDIILL
jgi:Xaa-Pro aminopeptidase